MAFIVAIDGTAGSGKGTVAETLAKKFKLTSIDTGAMYRCVALETINKKIAIDDKEKIIELVSNIKIELQKEKVYLDGQDVSEKIRTTEVTKIVSQISAIKEVREKLVEMQRKIASGKDVIMEGRDITTVVFPNADIKIYMDADVEIRAKRRYEQNVKKGINTPLEEVLDDMKKRDENDKNKECGALKITDGAIIIDTTNLSKNDVVNKISKIIKEKKKAIKLEKDIYAVRPENTRKKVIRKITKGFLAGIYHIVYRVKIVGLENLPKNGGYIICGNHINTLDAAAIVLLSKNKIRFIGKHDLFRFGILRWLAHLFDIIPIKRNSQDMEAMKRCLKALKNNEILGIFPEGTRKGLDKHVKLKSGATFMAMRAGVPIVPVGIQGTFKPFTKVVLNYGKPMTFENYNIQNKEDLENATKAVMDNIIMLTNDKK